MNYQRWADIIIDLFKEKGLTFKEAKRVLENTIRILEDEKLPPKGDGEEKEEAAQSECAAME